MSDASGSQWLAAGITALGACIAWGQWYTARQKLVLDLFDKRYACYKEIRAATPAVIGLEERTRPAILRFTRSTFETEYLFGADVIEHSMKMREIAMTITAMDRTHESFIAKNRAVPSPLMDEIIALERTFERSAEELFELLMPYLHMDQKLPRPPYEGLAIFFAWVKHRWINRPTGE